MNNPIAEKLSQASVLMEDTPHPELAEALRIGSNEIERLERLLHSGTSSAKEYEINRLVNRFLGWRLPDNFRPDAGISFNPEYNVEYNAARGLPPARHQPVGTNLFDHGQAKAMRRAGQRRPLVRRHEALQIIGEEALSTDTPEPAMHSQAEMLPCPYCSVMFTPKRRWERFCSPKCRTAYDVDFGTQGKVASVRRIGRGASVVIHLTGPAAERALNLELRDVVRVVKPPS